MLRIAEARARRGWSQERLAEAIGSTQQTIQRWETGQTDPQVSKVEAISSALDVTVSYLVGDSSEREGSTPATLTEVELLDLYRSCDPRGRVYLLEVARVTAALFSGRSHAPQA